MNPKLDISCDRLRNLYLQDGKTIKEVAYFFSCSPTTIRRRLNEYSIEIYPHGPRERVVTPCWSSQMAYAVALLVTDGNLSKDGRHLTFTSSDFELLEIFNHCLNKDLRILPQSKKSKNCYRIQWSNRSFYRWLVEIGLKPNKSSQLGTIDVPFVYYPDFVRGCLDGDGNINVYLDQRNSYKGKIYKYERLCLRFTSASIHFLEWLRSIIFQSIEVKGGIYAKKAREGHQPIWDLKYGKKESICILRWVYHSQNIPRLTRKYDKAQHFLA